MRKLILLSLILLIPLVSAVEFDMKQEFSQQETLMAKVSGNFLQPLQKENIFFYRGHIRIPFDYGIKKINNDYYLYAQLSGKDPNNYTLALENLRYMKAGEISQEDLAQNFTINTDTAEFSIDPGFASGVSFSLDVKNQQDNEITVEIKTKDSADAEAEEYAEPLTLLTGQEKEIDFSFVLEEPTFKFIELSTENLTYEIPAYIPATEITDDGITKFEPQELIVSASTELGTTRTVYLYNTRNEQIKNITVSVSNSLEPYVNVSEEHIKRINSNSNIPIELTFTSNEQFEVSGQIKVKHDSEIIYLPVSVKFLTDYVPTPEPEPEKTDETCAEKGYPICSSSEVCSSDEVVYATDDACCVGTCAEKEQPDSTGIIIGVSIIAVIIILVVWFFKKYKGTKKPFDLLKIAKGKK